MIKLEAILLIVALLLPGLVLSQTTTYSYDETGRLTSVDYGANGSISYEYDNNGNRLQRIVANGKAQVPGRPTGITATDGTFSDRVRVTFNTVAGATVYRVYRCLTAGQTCGTSVGFPTTGSFDDKKGIPGTVYYYRVRACNAIGCGSFSASDTGFSSVAPPRPTGVKATDGAFSDRVRVTFNTVAGATVYRVFRCLTVGQTCGTPVGFTKVGSFDDKKGVPGAVYFYRVRACTNTTCSKFSVANTGFSSTGSTTPSRPTGIKATDGTFPDKVRVTFNTVAGATVYRVFRCQTTGQTCGTPVGFPKTGSFDDRKGVSGTVYFYRVRACTNTCSLFSAANAGHRGTKATAEAEAEAATLMAEPVRIPSLSEVGLMLLLAGIVLVVLGRRFGKARFVGHCRLRKKHFTLLYLFVAVLFISIPTALAHQIKPTGSIEVMEGQDFTVEVAPSDEYDDCLVNSSVVITKGKSIISGEGIQNGVNHPTYTMHAIKDGDAEIRVTYNGVGSTCTSGQIATIKVTVVADESSDPRDVSSAGCTLCSDAGEPVNTFSGELYEPLPADINLGGPLPLMFERYYAAFLRRGSIVGDLGSNWRHNFDGKLFVSGNTASYVSYKGRVTDFLKNSDTGNWVQQTNLDTSYKLAKPEGQDAVLYDPQHKLIYDFDFTSGDIIVGKLVSVRDGKGNAHTVTYNLANGQIKTVSDGLGRTLTLTYNTDATPKISMVSDGTRSVSFQYTDPVDSEYLTLATDVRDGITTYAYKDTSANADHALMLRWTLPRGNVPYSQTFDAQGRVAVQTDASGNTLGFAYGTPTTGKTTLTDALGVTRVHSTAPSGAFNGMRDQVGRSFTLTTDAKGRRKSMTDRLGGKTSFSYHAASGNVSSVTNADTTMGSFSYTPRTVSGLRLHDMTGITNPDGTKETLTRDASGNLLSHTDQLGNTKSFIYNGSGQVLRATNKLSGVTRNIYNADATLRRLMDPAGNNTRFAYDPLKRLNRITHADGAQRSMTLDAADHPLTLVDENGNTSTMTWDANGNLASLRDPLMKTTRFTYDGNDRLIRVRDALGGVSRMTYRPLGGLGTIRDANGNVTSFGYNKRGRMTRIIDALGNVWPRSYDAEAIIKSSADPLGNTTTFMSDTMGRITQITSPLGNVYRASYDPMGHVATTANALNQVTTYSRDARGYLSGISLPGGAISATYARNALGEIIEITDPTGNLWQRGYDSSGRLTSTTDPLGRSETITYDNRNRRSSINLPAMLGTQTLTYDAVGNLTGVSYTDGTTFGLAYDANNRLVSANNGAGTANKMTRVYDANDGIKNSNGIIITRDAGGRIVSMRLAAGKTVNYEYDANDRVTSVTDWLGSITTFSYDIADRLTGITRPNGVNQTNTWDKDSRLKNITEGSISTINLSRDANGQITAATRNVPTPVNPSALISSTHTYDAASQIKSRNHDALGRQTAAGADHFVWDAGSRLTRYTIDGITVVNTYDALGRRIRRASGGSSSAYVWNDALELASISVERRGGVVFRYFIHLLGGELLYSIDAATNTRRYYHYDEMGNTIFVTNQAGTVIASYAYTPFGELTASSGMLDNPFTWQGEYGVMDEGNNLYYVRARFYDSEIGRFISRDRITSSDPREINPYQYADNNPLRFVDPRGLDISVPKGPGITGSGKFKKVVIVVDDLDKNQKKVLKKALKASGSTGKEKSGKPKDSKFQSKKVKGKKKAEKRLLVPLGSYLEHMTGLSDRIQEINEARGDKALTDQQIQEIIDRLPVLRYSHFQEDGGNENYYQTFVYPDGTRVSVRGLKEIGESKEEGRVYIRIDDDKTFEESEREVNKKH